MVNRDIGFSLWLDFIERDYLKNEFSELIRKGVINGATSNPAIFKNAITTSPAYREEIEKMRGASPKEIYEKLAIQDIALAADIMKDLYAGDDDGFVSIEVDPFLCDDTEGTVAEAKRLHRSIDRPNIMIKVPATMAGYDAMEALIAEGIHVNATLIFDPVQAEGCLNAFELGVNRFVSLYPDTPLPKAVISIFVSRFDRMMDAALGQKGLPQGRLGIYNATKIYHMIEKRGLPNVRALFASTGVKGDAYPADYYVSELLYKNAVNTAPLETIEAFVEGGDNIVKSPVSEEEIEAFFTKLKRSGIDRDEIYKTLLTEGLDAFKKAFTEILEALEKG